MRSFICFTAVAALAAAAVAPSALAQFTSGNLVVMTVANNNGAAGSGAVALREYTLGGAATGTIVNLPTAGGDAFSLPNATSHERHLHRSTDGRYLLFTGYGVAPGATDPSLGSAPRVIARVAADGSQDLTTRLTDAYLGTTIRSVVSTDGEQFWIAGDNFGDTTTSGGLRYTTRGSSTTVNLSRTQTNGGAPQADNLRDLGIFGGQLFDSSGSGSSTGRGVFQVGSGLPTSGAQPLVNLTNSGVNSVDSASSFYMLDLDGAAGPDVVYFIGDTYVRRYNLVAGNWVFGGMRSGFASSNALDQIIAAPDGSGGVTIYVAGPNAVQVLTDSTPTSTGAATFSAPTTLISAPAGATLGGIEFSVPTPGAAGLLLAAAPAALRRRRR